MVRTILKYVALGMVLLLIAAWLWAGGFRAVANFVRTIPNPIDIIWGTATSTYEVELPWQIDIPQGPDIELYLKEADERYASLSPEERVAELEREYDALQEEAAKQARSDYYGAVSLTAATADASDPASEHLVLDSRSGRSISLQGWSLMSTVTGVRVAIPPASVIYRDGMQNSLEYVILEPGANAIVVSGRAPLGVSFRENRCTGYLTQGHSYQPTLTSACPSPAETMTLTDQNLQRYGSDCVDYVRTLPQCTYPATVPASLAPACRIYIANTFSYNGCVEAHQYEPDFSLGTWRLYIGATRELWSNRHDAIYLLDAYGKTVDTIIY